MPEFKNESRYRDDLAPSMHDAVLGINLGRLCPGSLMTLLNDNNFSRNKLDPPQVKKIIHELEHHRGDSENSFEYDGYKIKRHEANKPPAGQPCHEEADADEPAKATPNEWRHEVTEGMKEVLVEDLKESLTFNEVANEMADVMRAIKENPVSTVLFAIRDICNRQSKLALMSKDYYNSLVWASMAASLCISSVREAEINLAYNKPAG